MFAQIPKEVLRFLTGPRRQGRGLDVQAWPVLSVLTDQEAFPTSTGISIDIEPVAAWIWHIMAFLPAREKVSTADDVHCELNIYIYIYIYIETFVF